MSCSASLVGDEVVATCRFGPSVRPLRWLLVASRCGNGKSGRAAALANGAGVYDMPGTASVLAGATGLGVRHLFQSKITTPRAMAHHRPLYNQTIRSASAPTNPSALIWMIPSAMCRKSAMSALPPLRL
jgi:hypothetical protein